MEAARALDAVVDLAHSHGQESLRCTGSRDFSRHLDLSRVLVVLLHLTLSF